MQCFSNVIFSSSVTLPCKSSNGKTVTNRTPVCKNSYMEETVNTDRDRKKEALCNNCGSPYNLHVCAGKL